MRTLALCIVPAVMCGAFVVGLIRTFRPTSDTQGEQ